MKPLLWILAALAALAAAMLLLIAMTIPRGHPNAQQARRDFLADHPTHTIERIDGVELEVAAVSYRIFYRVPGDPSLHEEFRQYVHHSDGQWHLSPRRPNP
ncbi:MAG TPA: hypothetical protein PLA50_04195 [Bacteroidia bacterium]|nr:hypothetical protein [Bacteroidia bacterium]